MAGQYTARGIGVARYDALDRRAELGMDTQLGMQKVEALLDVYRAELKDLFLSTKAAT